MTIYERESEALSLGPTITVDRICKQFQNQSSVDLFLFIRRGSTIDSKWNWSNSMVNTLSARSQWKFDRILSFLPLILVWFVIFIRSWRLNNKFDRILDISSHTIKLAPKKQRMKQPDDWSSQQQQKKHIKLKLATSMLFCWEPLSSFQS